jgi:hypothetical protein
MSRFNINDEVLVKLTDLGRARLQLNHEELFAVGVRKHPYAPPKETDGWSRWQLWTLMREFGPHVRNGGLLMFETEIEIPEHQWWSETELRYYPDGH